MFIIDLIMSCDIRLVSYHSEKPLTLKLSTSIIVNICSTEPTSYDKRFESPGIVLMNLCEIQSTIQSDKRSSNFIQDK
jgi:hypothetical protein